MRVRSAGDELIPVFEQLEPRILLSADPVGLNLIDSPASDSYGEAAIVVDYVDEPHERVPEVWSGSEKEPTGPETEADPIHSGVLNAENIEAKTFQFGI